MKLYCEKCKNNHLDLFLSYNLELDSNKNEIMQNSKLGLIPRKVPVHLPSGRVVEGIRWIRPHIQQTMSSGKVRIPPGWVDVWVAENKSSPLQVVGKDSKGRPQYLYSTKHSQKAAAAKFN